MSNWKSVKELPPKSGHVLVAYKHFGISMVGEGFCKVHSDGRATFNEIYYNGKGVEITHWMPLPEFPMDNSNVG